MAGGSRRYRIAAAVVLALAGGAGCGDGASDGEGAGIPSTQQSASNGSDRIATRLELLPVPDGASQGMEVRVGDLNRVTDLVGVPRPTSLADRQALSDWQYAILGIRLPPEAGDTELRPSPAAVPRPQSAIPDRGAEDSTNGDGPRGWNLLDVGWFAEGAPLRRSPHLTAVLGGTFTAERLTSSLGEPDASVWSRDPASIVERDATSPGTWLHAGLAAGNLVVSDNPEAVRSATDRRGPTVADNRVLVDLADALDAHGAHSAVLRSQASGFPFPQRPGTDPEVVERARNTNLLFPDRFTGVGVGLSADDGPLGLVVYAHADGRAAARNADFLRVTLEEGNRSDGQPWADLFTVEGVTADGRVVTARLRFTDGGAGHIFDLPLEADPTLFTHR